VTGAVALCDAKNVNGIRFVTTGAGDENTSDSVAIEKMRSNIATVLGKTAPASFATQYSVAYGRNGMCAALGMGSKGARGALPTLDLTNPVTVATLTALRNLSGIAVSDLADALRAKRAKRKA
jgi:hypothetical protein